MSFGILPATCTFITPYCKLLVNLFDQWGETWLAWIYKSIFRNFVVCCKMKRSLKTYLRLKRILRTADAAGGRLFICGNGGSFGTAAHLATDFSKQAKISALTIQDSAMTTALANDFGFDETILLPFQQHSDIRDVLMLLSVSGKSPNLIKAANFAKVRGNKIITFTGHSPSSPLAKIASAILIYPLAIFSIIKNVKSEKSSHARSFC